MLLAIFPSSHFHSFHITKDRTNHPLDTDQVFRWLFLPDSTTESGCMTTSCIQAASESWICSALTWRIAPMILEHAGLLEYSRIAVSYPGDFCKSNLTISMLTIPRETTALSSFPRLKKSWSWWFVGKANHDNHRCLIDPPRFILDVF